MELLLVFIIAVIVMRPADWQRFAVFLGRSLRLFRHYQNQFKTTLAKIETPVNLNHIYENTDNIAKSAANPESECKKP